MTLPRRAGAALLAAAAATVAATLPAPLAAQAPARGAASFKAPPARFADPDRAAKLAATFPEIDRVFREYAEREHIPGAVWGIIVDGRLAHVGVTGYRDVAAKAPVDSSTVFRIASMTKSFTAMAIMKLRDEGKLSLDDPAEKWVPELRGLTYPTTDSPRITIRHLMSHAEGFPEDNPWGDQQLAESEESFSRMMRGGIPFSNAPGVAYEYSNYGFAILGRIVTRASGVPYRRYIQETILRPLGMTSTTLEPQLPDGAFGAMGGMLTSTRDLGIYVARYLDAWPARDGADPGPVRRASLREMQQIHRPNAGATFFRGPNGPPQLASGGYGFGLGISGNCDFAHIVAHSGGLPGFGSLMRWLPEYGVGIIAFGNRTYTGWGGPTNEAFALMRRTGALEPREPQPSPALEARREAVTRLILKWDDALADSLASVNLFLDRSRDRRRAEIQALTAKVGPCRSATEWNEVENALRGSWTIPCERGALRVAITLAPTTPPRVQHLSVREAPAPTPPPRRRHCS